MKRRSTTILLITIAVCVIGCKPIEVREIRRMTGHKLVLPDDIYAFDSVEKIIIHPNQEQVKVVTYLDYNKCTDCMVKPLIALETVLSVCSIDPGKLCIIAFVDSADSNELISSLRKFHLRSNISVDNSSYVKNSNNIGKLSAKNRTFVIDKNNKIVFTGNPVLNRSLQDSFLYVLSNLDNNNGNFIPE